MAVHRAGQRGRAGGDGDVMSFADGLIRVGDPLEITEYAGNFPAA